MRARISLRYSRYKLAKTLDYLRYICNSFAKRVDDYVDIDGRVRVYTHVSILELCTVLTRNIKRVGRERKGR